MISFPFITIFPKNPYFEKMTGKVQESPKTSNLHIMLIRFGTMINLPIDLSRTLILRSIYNITMFYFYDSSPSD